MGWGNSSDVKVIPCMNEALGLGHGTVLKKTVDTTLFPFSTQFLSKLIISNYYC